MGKTLLTCGCSRLYKTLADRLLREEDVLRENPDIALLYYALVRALVENNQMMHDTQGELSIRSLWD